MDISRMSLDDLLRREWLTTNGAGSYASSTAAGINTRKYHGLFVAAMAPPRRPMVLLSRLEETILGQTGSRSLDNCEYPGVIFPQGHRLLRAFSEDPFPRWAFQADGWTIEKTLRLFPGQNTLGIRFALIGAGAPVDLQIRPLFALRSVHELMYQSNGRLAAEVIDARGDAPVAEAKRLPPALGAVSPTHHHILATNRTPECFFSHDGAFHSAPDWYFNAIYRREIERGYSGLEDTWAPAAIRWTLQPGQCAHFICSTDPIDWASAMGDMESPARRPPIVQAHGAARRTPPRELAQAVVNAEAGIAKNPAAEKHATGERAANRPLPSSPIPPSGIADVSQASAGESKPVLAGAKSIEHAARADLETLQRLAALARSADQFILTGSAAIRSKQTGQEVHILAGYPWASLNGRDALIALPGLLLVTGRFSDARSVLKRFVAGMHRGLMPSEWPHDGSAPRYAAADISLWFVYAAQSYLRYDPREGSFRQELHDAIDRILSAYQRGLPSGIELDSEGLLGVHKPLASWMDAKVGDDWVTPRHGRPVELNALWYNALRFGADVAQQAGRPSRAGELLALANAAAAAFNRRFWNVSSNCLFDVVTDHLPDASIRPNQLLALSLPYPVLAIERHLDVLKVVTSELLTPFGLRTLGRGEPAYQGKYTGGPVQRDRAYHQGSVYPWLLGPHVGAMLRIYGRSSEQRLAAGALLEPCLSYLSGEGVGQLCELFDGNAPHHPGGLIASARSVAELLRCYAEDVLDLAPLEPTRPAADARLPDDPPRLRHPG